MKKNGEKNQSVCETKSAFDSASVLVASVLLKKKKKMKKMEKKIRVCLCMLQSIVVCYFKKWGK